MEANAALPANDADLSTIFTSQQYLDVRIDDGVRVQRCATNEYSIFLFKKQNVNNTDKITLTWDGQSGYAPATSPVVMQIYNQNSSTWETVDSDNVTLADTDFVLTAIIDTNVSNYYDIGNWVSWRIYQLMQ